MADMRLISLKLNNFQGIKEFVFEPNGEDATILGANATGKTTLFNSFTWLLFGKDSLGQSNFEIKNLDEQGKPAHGLSYEVEATLDYGETGEINFRKVYAEKWTKKRGSAEKEFTGHTIDHFIDRVPVKANEFSAAVNRIADEQLFKLLTSPKYFNEQLHWQKRREVLLDVCGNISDEDVIASDPALAELPVILGSRKLDDHRKVLAGRRTEVNRELSDVPIRISECQKGMIEIANTDPKHAASKLTMLRAELTAKQQEKARIETGGEIAEKTKALREVESKLIDLDNKERRARESFLSALNKQVMETRAEIASHEGEISRVDTSIAKKKIIKEDLQAEIEQLRIQWVTVDSNQFDPDGKSSICPTCGQNIPDDQIKAAIEEFNIVKARKLASISDKGRQAKAEIQGLDDSIRLAGDAVVRIQSQLKDLDQILKDLQPEPNDTPGILDPICANPERIALLEAKQAIENAIQKLRDGTVLASLTAIVAEIQTIETEISAQEALIAQIDQNAKAEARIKDLKAQERKLASEYERIEKELYLTDLFIRVKVSQLTDRINAKFQLARWKLFDVAINGGLQECAEVTYLGVPYSSLNSAMRTNIGIDICNTLSEFHGVSVPQFLDNCESVNEILPSKSQQIKLYVSDHKTLTIGE
jgi:DNA repair exonuclease SbcCD ATPase subunit